MNARAASLRRRVQPRSDRERELVTPEGIALPITIASRGARAGALIMDLVLIGFLQLATTILLIMLAFGSLSALANAGGRGFGALEFLFVVWVIAMFLFRNAYFLYFELGPRGATPGKRMVGICIASRDGGRLSAEMVIARNLLRDIELFLPLTFLSSASGSDDAGPVALASLAWFLIFTLFPLWNRDRLRAGDIVAGTWVVERPRVKLESALSSPRTPDVGQAPQGAASAVPPYQFSEEELDVYGEYELQTLERVLRDGRMKALGAVHRTIAAKIGRSDGMGDENAFLSAYYTQLRARLESRMRMGERKPDKFA